MAHQPYPDRDRALRQLARKERRTRRIYTTPLGSLAEEYEFPGQSLAVMAAQLRAGAPRALARLTEAMSTTSARLADNARPTPLRSPR